MNFEKNISLFFAVIAALLLIGFTAHCINHNVETIDSKFSTVENASFNVAFAYEDLTADYHANNITAVIEDDEKVLLDAQKNYIIATVNLGKLASKDTFCKMLSYSLHINDLTPTTYTIDASKLKTSQENTKIKHDILYALFADNEAYHNVFAGIATLFGDKNAYKYSRKDCPNGMDNVPASARK